MSRRCSRPPRPRTGPGATLPAPSRPYREGVLGRPVSVSPLSARTQADRDLVALVYSGLVRNGPSGSLVPDLAERWTVDSTGSVWTFYLRDDARWHDGEPVTAEDVAFTIGVLQDPKYTGPGAGSWNEVTVATQGALTVVFTLKTPLGGFLQAATQPIAPAHILAGIPADQLPDRPFGRQPIGSGPFAVASLSNDTAELIPAGTILPPDVPGDGTTPVATDSLATPGPASPPARPVPYLNGMEFQFFDDPEKLAVAYRDGKLDAVSGLSPTMTRDLGQASDSKVLRVPRLDIDRSAAQPPTRSSRIREPRGAGGPACGDRPASDRRRMRSPCPPAWRRVSSLRLRSCSTARPTRRSPTIRPPRRWLSSRPAGPAGPMAGISPT